MPAAISVNRSTTRLREFDYASSGAYFVTVCAAQKAHLFGAVSSGEVQCSEIGDVILEEWRASAQIRQELALDAFVIMPNHIHGIVWLLEENQAVLSHASIVSGVGATGRSPLRGNVAAGPAKKSLGAFVAGFKSAVTTRINKARATPSVPVWQRNYHDRIIRNDRELNAVREYIAFNPHNWSSDLEAQSEPMWDVAA